MRTLGPEWYKCGLVGLNYGDCFAYARAHRRQQRLLFKGDGFAQTDVVPVNEISRTVRAGREVAATAEAIFELIADPARQPLWDGNDNLAEAPVGQRVRGAGEVFAMVLTGGSVRENHVVEFEEARRIAWRPADPGQRPAGHLWRWELEPMGQSRTKVTHTYDWSQLTDEHRFDRARSTTPGMLRASLDRLADVAERGS